MEFTIAANPSIGITDNVCCVFNQNPCTLLLRQATAVKHLTRLPTTLIRPDICRELDDVYWLVGFRIHSTLVNSPTPQKNPPVFILILLVVSSCQMHGSQTLPCQRSTLGRDFFMWNSPDRSLVSLLETILFFWCSVLRIILIRTPFVEFFYAVIT
jgi:hypothetical protein